MNDQVIAIDCLCNDFLKSIELDHKQWCNEKMTDAEVIQKKIHAVTAREFELKIINFIIVVAIKIFFF